MTKNDIMDRVEGIVSDILDVDPIEMQEGHDIVTDYGADSLDTVEIAMGVEEEFGVSIPDEVLYSDRAPRTLAEIRDYVASALGVTGE